MLPKTALDLRIDGGRVFPTWLGEVDEPFVAQCLEVIDDLDARASAEANTTARALLAPIARRAGYSPRIAEALWIIESRRWDSRIASPVPPEALRDVVFDLAAEVSREEALARTAEQFGMLPDQIRPSLFADRKSRRILVAASERSAAADLVLRYNLLVAQTLLLRAMDVEASVDGDVERIAIVAKREGLLARFEERGGRTRIELSGPMALLHDTSKYGRALARFVPALVSAPHWTLRARIVLGAEESAWLELDAYGAIRFAHTLPASTENRTIRRIARVVKTTRSGFRVEEAPLVRLGDLVLVPDFVLVGERGRVFVDIVPFATDAFLAKKLAAAKRSSVPMLVCVDARWAPPDPTGLEEVTLLRYRGQLDPFVVLTAAERLLSASSCSLSSSSPSPALPSLPSLPSSLESARLLPAFPAQAAARSPPSR